MKVWQPGSHLTRSAAPRSSDWSWQRDRAAHHDARAARARRTSCADGARARLRSSPRRLTALAPPYLAKLAIDDGIRDGDLHALDWSSSSLFVVAGVAEPVASCGADVLHGLDGRAHPRRPAQHALPPPAAALARLLRAQPRGRDHQPAHERRRGARPARHRRRDDARPEHAHPGRHGRHPLLPRLAARARDADACSRSWSSRRRSSASRSARAYRAVRERLGLVTATLAEDIGGMRVVQAFRARSANERSFREVNAHYREANQQTVVLNGLYFPFVDFLSALATAIVLGYGGYLVFRRRHHGRHALRVRPLPVELLRPGAAALAALQHVPLGRRPRSTRSWT